MPCTTGYAWITPDQYFFQILLQRYPAPVYFGRRLHADKSVMPWLIAVPRYGFLTLRKAQDKPEFMRVLDQPAVAGMVGEGLIQHGIGTAHDKIHAKPGPMLAGSGTGGVCQHLRDRLLVRPVRVGGALIGNILIEKTAR